MGSSSQISIVTDYLRCLPYLSVPIELQQCQPDPSNGQISFGPLQRSTFHSVLQTPPADELPQRLPKSSIGQPSIAPSEFRYPSTFCGFLMQPDLSSGQSSDKLLHQTNFRRTSLAIGLQSDFSIKKFSSGLLQQMTSVCSFNA